MTVLASLPRLFFPAGGCVFDENRDEDKADRADQCRHQILRSGVRGKKGKSMFARLEKSGDDDLSDESQTLPGQDKYRYEESGFNCFCHPPGQSTMSFRVEFQRK